MKLIISLFILFLVSIFAAKTISEYSVVEKKFDVGVHVVEFNASFNSNNSVSWINDLTDCSVYRLDILLNPELKKEYDIVVVPTIIVLNNGKEKKRFQADIMMVMKASKKDVQESVNQVVMSSL